MGRPHEYYDRRSLAFHRLIAIRLCENPELLEAGSAAPPDDYWIGIADKRRFVRGSDSH